MALAPVSQLIKIKPRPETTLNLINAIGDPEGTIRDYVFTPSIKEALKDILWNVGSGRGRGYWALSEYGGGKTHFLAAVAALLSSHDQVHDLIDDNDIQQEIGQLRDQKLFPVGFSLIGEAPVMDRRHALYSILEQQIADTAQKRLYSPITVTLSEDVGRWWDSVGPQIRDAIAAKCQELFSEDPDQVRLDSEERWLRCVWDSAYELHIGIQVDTAPRERLKNIYRQIVNRQTGYTGLLLIIDEYGNWQDRHPEGTVAYTESEDLLQTLAEVLPREDGLALFTLVASQHPMPRKFQGGRFAEIDVLRMSEFQSRPSREYEMVVAKRVRMLEEYRSPEIEEYYDHYRRRFQFARDLSLEEFRITFPVQPFCFDILRRVTTSLATARVGINVLWDVLGQETSQGPQLSPRLDDLRRLVTAGDLLESENLKNSLQTVRFVGAYRAYQQASELLDRMDIDREEELPLARAVVRTLFLWHVARSGQVPMRLSEMAEAVVADESLFDSAEDAVLNVVALMEGLPQVRYDAQRQEFSFHGEVVLGRAPAEIFEEYRGHYPDPHRLEQHWRGYLTNENIGAAGQNALFRGLQAGTPARTPHVYGSIDYSGEEIAAESWYQALGEKLDFDRHFRVVYLLRPVAVTPEVLEDRRIAVCVPSEFSGQQVEAVRSLLALDQMYADYQHREDDEGLRVQQFVQNRRLEVTTALLNAQRDAYRHGRIVTKESIALDPGQVFELADRLTPLITGLFGVVFRDRAITAFRRANVALRVNEVGYVFQGLFAPTPTGRLADAVDNFSVGLGLALQGAPRRFDPSGCRAFQDIRELYQHAQQSGHPLSVDRIYDALALKGIPARLATLYLLCFVRRAEEGVELMLREGHRLRLNNGTAPPGNQLTSALVREVAWENRWAGDDCLKTFDVLTTRSGLPWNEALAWTRKVRSDLRTATDPTEVEQQQALLLDSLAALADKAERGIEALQNLGRALGAQALPDLLDSLRQVKALSAAQTYEELVDRAQESCADADALGEKVSAVERLAELARREAAIAAAYSYLNAIPQDRLEANLEVDRNALSLQFNLDSFAKNPALWPGLEGPYNEWKRRYQRAYRQFHRDYQEKVVQAQSQGPGAQRRLTALDHLEQVQGLAAEKQAARLRNALQAALGRLVPCGVDVNSLNLDSQPHCARCQVRFEEAPEVDLDSLVRRTDQAWEGLLAAFQGQAIRGLLESSSEPGAQEFAQALDVSDRERLVTLLQSPDSVALLEGVLKVGQVRVKRVHLTEALRKEFPTVSRAQLEDVALRIMELLEEAIKEAEQEAGEGAQVEVQIA